MTYQFTISDIGLRLIKAYEGYVPGGRLTRDGQKLVGYGHLTADMDAKLDEDEAEELLKSELTAIQSLINTHVHAALTQGQFDALCSLAHSIGPGAFLASDTLHALNRGEIITAANGFDSWRLGNIDGQIYVVDALVRRRTAEKALFLRPVNRTVPAPHATLKAFYDTHEMREQIAQVSSRATHGEPAQSDEGETGADLEPLELVDKVDDEETFQSPIAEAAAEVSERLDALMDKPAQTDVTDWPDSLVETNEPSPASNNVVQLPRRTNFTETAGSEILTEVPTAPLPEAQTVPTISEEKATGEYEFSDHSSAEKYIEPAKTTDRQGLWAYAAMIVLGLAATGGGLYVNFNGLSDKIGELGPLLTSAAVAMGVVLLLMGTYYLFKQLFGKG
ncbi:MAG: lysozyme [Hellea sp.]|nr:lysozyme [Hellea sp.]